MNKQEIKKILANIGIKLNKGLGQNFLIDKKVISQIVKAGKVGQDDTVLEIGPGLGFLTKKLLVKAGQVIGVEIDPNLNIYLKTKFKDGSLKLIKKDILKVDLDDLIEKKYKIVSSIPYQISSPLIKKLAQTKNKPQLAVFLLQKEVGQRIAAPIGSSQRGFLTILAQFYFKPKIISEIKPASFYPQPKVDSVILKLIPKKLNGRKGSFDLLSKVAQAGFNQKRKKIVNSLFSGLDIDKNKLKKILKELKIDANLRAEDLSITDWHKISKEIG